MTWRHLRYKERNLDSATLFASLVVNAGLVGIGVGIFACPTRASMVHQAKELA